MKRKIFSLLLILCLFMATMVPALAFEDDELYFVTDEADILTDSEASALEELAASVSNTYHCGVYVVIVSDYYDYGNTPADAHKRIYDSHALGYGWGRDGLMLLLSMAERDYYLGAYGEQGTYAFTDRGLTQLEDSFLDEFAGDIWYEGLEDYLNECAYFLAQAAEGEPIAGGSSPAMKLVLILGIPCLIALIVCMVFKAQMKSVRKQTSAAAYMTASEEGLRVREDRFTHRTETRRKIQSSSSSRTTGSGGKF